MFRMRFVPIAVTLAALLACTGAIDGDALVEPAQKLLKKGDLPGAYDAYATLEKDNGNEVLEIAIGKSYMHLLAGEYDEADKVLTRIAKEEIAGDKLPEIQLRRAIVALRSKNYDDVKKYGKESGLPAGKLLAGEVHLLDAEHAEAQPLLEAAAKGKGMVGSTAQAYLDLLNADDEVRRSLADINAMWALGDRATACDTAADTLERMSTDYEDRDMLLLVWAGRAVTSDASDVAEQMLDQITSPPEGQAWRIPATRAMIQIARGKNDEGIAAFTALRDAGAPADGLYDALATAAALTEDAAVAQQLAGELESNAAARGLLRAGAKEAAKQAAPSNGTLAKYLENI